MNRNIVRASKFLSLKLRHKPENIGLSLDENGWANIAEIIDKTTGQTNALSLELIQEVVATSDKQRFMISEDGGKVRANQGHSISVELNLDKKQPPEFLYHGTATRFLKSILENGLEKRQRQHVHLSEDLHTASKVGVRHGKLAILQIAAKEMYSAGAQFYLSANGVWLTDNVPAKFLSVIE